MRIDPRLAAGEYLRHHAEQLPLADRAARQLAGRRRRSRWPVATARGSRRNAAWHTRSPGLIDPDRAEVPQALDSAVLTHMPQV